MRHHWKENCFKFPVMSWRKRNFTSWSLPLQCHVSVAISNPSQGFCPPQTWNGVSPMCFCGCRASLCLNIIGSTTVLCLSFQVDLKSLFCWFSHFENIRSNPKHRVIYSASSLCSCRKVPVTVGWKIFTPSVEHLLLSFHESGRLDNNGHVFKRPGIALLQHSLFLFQVARPRITMTEWVLFVPAESSYWVVKVCVVSNKSHLEKLNSKQQGTI